MQQGAIYSMFFLQMKLIQLEFLLEFNDIESMYLFNLENQKSIKEIDKYDLFMASEILFNDITIQNFRQIFRKIKINDKEEYYKSISENILLPGSEQFYPILFNKFDSIINYFAMIP